MANLPQYHNTNNWPHGKGWEFVGNGELRIVNEIFVFNQSFFKIGRAVGVVDPIIFLTNIHKILKKLRVHRYELYF